jgi:hypothetical protein
VLPKKLNYELQIVSFNYDKCQYTTMFRKAKIEISIISGDISKASTDYISMVATFNLYYQGKRRRIRKKPMPIKYTAVLHLHDI